MLRNIIFILISLFAYSLTVAQTTMGIMEYSRIREGSELPLDIPENVERIADIDNTYAPYLGTWTASTVTGKITFFILENQLDYIGNTTIDVLRIHYMVEDFDGDVIFDSRNMPPNTFSGFNGRYFKSDGSYVGRWYHAGVAGSRCNSSGFFSIKLSRDLFLGDTLDFSYIFGRDMGHISCSDGYNIPPLPKDQTVTFSRP